MKRLGRRPLPRFSRDDKKEQEDDDVSPWKEPSASSIFGTWTAQLNLTSHIADAHVQAYFVVYFMPDPTAAYACRLHNCSEYKNEICQEGYSNQQDPSEPEYSCQSMSDTVSNWAHVSAFYYMGFSVQAGHPFYQNRTLQTGEWIGPYSLIMAHVEASTSNSSNTPQPSHQYAARYVQTASTTSLMHGPQNDTLFRGMGPAMDFDTVVGATAVRNTILDQASHPQSPTAPPMKIQTHNEYQEGQWSPRLPLYTFDFTKPIDASHHDGRRFSSPSVQVDWQIPIIPRSTTQKYMPWIKREIKRYQDEHGALSFFSLEGPFPVGRRKSDERDNVDRPAWALRVAFDSAKIPTQESSPLEFRYGCVSGLPCVPPSIPNTKRDAPSSNNVTTNSNEVWQRGFGLVVILWMVTLLLWIKSNLSSKRIRRSLVSRELISPDVSGDIFLDTTADTTIPLLQESSMYSSEDHGSRAAENSSRDYEAGGISSEISSIVEKGRLMGGGDALEKGVGIPSAGSVDQSILYDGGRSSGMRNSLSSTEKETLKEGPARQLFDVDGDDASTTASSIVIPVEEQLQGLIESLQQKLERVEFVMIPEKKVNDSPTSVSPNLGDGTEQLKRSYTRPVALKNKNLTNGYHRNKASEVPL